MMNSIIQPMQAKCGERIKLAGILVFFFAYCHSFKLVVSKWVISFIKYFLLNGLNKSQL